MKNKIIGTHNRPRLYIFKSNKHIYAQMINDTNRTIIANSSSISQRIKKRADNISSTTCETARLIGKDIAEQCSKKGITHIVFDRGYKLYHGKIKALAESAREEGMIF